MTCLTDNLHVFLVREDNESGTISRQTQFHNLADFGSSGTEGCRNLAEAWDKLCAYEKAGNVKDKVHCIITDIEMPLMDGHRLTKLVKENDNMHDIPVIIFSSLVNDEMRRKGESLGADAQLTKPEIGSLVQAIDRLIDQTGK